LLLFARPLGISLVVVLPFIHAFIIRYKYPASNGNNIGRGSIVNEKKKSPTAATHTLPVAAATAVVVASHETQTVAALPIRTRSTATTTHTRYSSYTQSIVYSSRRHAPIYHTTPTFVVVLLLPCCLSNHRTHTVQYSTSYIRTHTHAIYTLSPEGHHIKHTQKQEVRYTIRTTITIIITGTHPILIQSGRYYYPARSVPA